MNTPSNAGRELPRLEVRLLDYAPRDERHGKVWHQGPFWFTGNFVFLAMMVGRLHGPEPGARHRLRHHFHGAARQPGPEDGPAADDPVPRAVRQPWRHRAVRGEVVYIGFIVSGMILLTQALQLVLPGSKAFWYPALVVLSIIVAVVGYDLLHFVQRWLTYVLIATFAVVTVMAVTALPQAPTVTVAATPRWDDAHAKRGYQRLLADSPVLGAHDDMHDGLAPLRAAAREHQISVVEGINERARA